MNRIPYLCRVAAAFAVAATAAQSASDVPAAGGLVSYPERLVGDNLLANPDFEGVGGDGKPAAWKDNGFVVDPSVRHGGATSLRLTDANTIPFAQSASQTIILKRGVYRIGGWVKLSGMAKTSGNGVRFCLYAPVAWPPKIGEGCTTLVKGTSDWQYLQMAGIVVSDDSPGLFVVQAHGEPDGTAWFDDLELRRETYPLQTSMLYPNYRGLLFEDGPQTARFRLDLDAEAINGESLIYGRLVDERSGSVLAERIFAASPTVNVALEVPQAATGSSWLASFTLKNKTDGVGYTYPAYRIVKASAATRAALTISFDEENRFRLHGKPAFLLGVYDSGMGYVTDETAWANQLTAERRLFELPINLYLNYWYGSAPNASILPLMSALQRRQIFNLTNANCFNEQTVEQLGTKWFVEASESVIHERAQHPGFAGFYAVDECANSVIPNVFVHAQRMRALGQGEIVFGILNDPKSLPLWRDALDVVGVDSYPLSGAEPSAGYPLHQVAEAASRTRDALFGSRPFVTVLQFFQNTSQARWPTQSELRSMSYAAIVGGADGLLYWSLGANALAYVCDGSDARHSPKGSGSWCLTRIEYFNSLKTVLHELKGIEPILAMPDRADLLTANANPLIHTRVKYDGTTVFLIAFNASGASQKTTFRVANLRRALDTNARLREVQVRGADIYDTFEPYGVRVYQLVTGPSVPASGQ